MRSLLIRTTTVLLGLVAGLIAAEVGLRVFDLAPAGSVTTVTQEEYRRVPGMLTPGQDLVVRDKPRLPYQLTTDSLGYRGTEHVAREKPPGQLRILFTGDSGTFGSFVDDDETLPAVLEERLRATCPGQSVQVINAGLPGSTIKGQRVVVRRGMALDPDVVLLMISENDIVDLANPIIDGLAENRRMKSRFPLSVVYPLLRETALWNLALEVRGALRANRAQEADGDGAAADSTRESAEEPAPFPRELAAAYRRHFEALASSLRSRNVSFHYVLYPTHLTLTGQRSDTLITWTESLGEANSVPTHNLLEPLRESGLDVEELYLVPEDGHPAPKGYEIAAEFLSRRLADLCTPAGED